MESWCKARAVSQGWHLVRVLWRSSLGALFDPHGYILFKTLEAYQRCPNLSHGVKLNVRVGISTIHGYVRIIGDDSGGTDS